MTQLPFNPLVSDWFGANFQAPTDVQLGGWRSIAEGRNTLIAAPTGSGKTLAAFLWQINSLVEEAVAGKLDDRIHTVYVSPLKALGNDIRKNLSVPLEEIVELGRDRGLELGDLRVAVRSGDTPQRERQLQVKRPPHILITTPESLYILLTAEKSRQALAHARTVIVDEIHAVAPDKRGAHLSLSLERLDALAGRPLQRIGLSATQKPIERVAALLTGARPEEDASAACNIIDAGHRRELELSIETADFELGTIASHEQRAEIYERIAELSAQNRTTIVFVNTRRLVERVAHALSELIGKDKVAAHHGSLSRETRLAAEEGLKNGTIPVVVATASLELGIDVGHIDLVVHLGAPRSIATLLQRVGRSGHVLGAVPRGVLFPLTRDDLVQSAAAVKAVYEGELDSVDIPENNLDILSQQIVASVAAAETTVDDLWAMVRRSHCYRRLQREEFEAVLETLAEGVSTRRGRRAAHIHYDRVNGRLRGRRGARLAAITGGGAIPDTADYDVIEEPAEVFIGKVNEDFAVESLAGDVFLLGNRPWRIQRVTAGQMRVVDAEGASPTVPFWLGEGAARSAELSEAVSELRVQIAERLDEPDGAADWLQQQCRLDRDGAEQLVAYVRDSLAMLGTLPTTDTIVAERFFDEAGGMQLVLHAPLGGRINRALGLSLRKKFCRTFDFELQAAATDDGVILSLGEQHSFPLDSVFSMLNSRVFEKDLVQASLASPMFTNRWRWNATRSLALLRHNGGKKVPMPIQRMRAEDLLAAVFPAQIGCQDNRAGDIELPDHPLVNETIGDCLHEAMDSDGLRNVLERIENGAVRTVAIETPAPSPLCHEILNANPYAFLDDAPLEERRARAVSLRRTDPSLASGLGSLDAEAVAEVRRQAWPQARDRDEVHDALLSLVVVPETKTSAWEQGQSNDQTENKQDPINELTAERRIVRMHFEDGRPNMFVAAERANMAAAAYPDARFTPRPEQIVYGAGSTVRGGGAAGEDEAVDEIVGGWMEALGPVSEASLSSLLSLPQARVAAALARLEAEGVVIRGEFFPSKGDESRQWCERTLLARIYRLTIGRLRSEIEPVTPAQFMKFVFGWQHVASNTRLHGRDGLFSVIGQLQGLELPGPAWERDVLPTRIENYEPADLEQLCLAGEVAWGRLSLTIEADDKGRRSTGRRPSPNRAAPLAFVLRRELEGLLAPLPEGDTWREGLGRDAALVLDYLRQRGASFLSDIARDLKLLAAQAEDALWELVAGGLVTGDGIAGLRTLLLPDHKRKQGRRAALGASPRHLRALPGAGRSNKRLMPIGRWSLLRHGNEAPAAEDERVESSARRLLARYGVLFRELCAREKYLPRWRELLRCLRLMEARGEIRGGRFVSGFVGEQFALPEAVESLRSVRRRPQDTDVMLVAAADPLNLAGIVTPGTRVSPFSGQVIAYHDGEVIDSGELGEVRSRLQSRLGARDRRG